MTHGRAGQMPIRSATAINIYSDLCKGCEICVDTCKFGVFEMTTNRGKQGYLLPRVAHLEKCTLCMLCELSCPDMAIEVLG